MFGADIIVLVELIVVRFYGCDLVRGSLLQREEIGMSQRRSFQTSACSSKSGGLPTLTEPRRCSDSLLRAEDYMGEADLCGVEFSWWSTAGQRVVLHSWQYHPGLIEDMRSIDMGSLLVR